MTRSDTPDSIGPRALCLAPGLLDGKTAWITGGGTGLGRAMAMRFAELGARVGVSGRREDPLRETVEAIRTAGGQAAWAVCDVRDPDAVTAALDGIDDGIGRPDILVNNAAAISFARPKNCHRTPSLRSSASC